MVITMITLFLIALLLEIKMNQVVKKVLIQQNQDCLQAGKMA